MGRPRSFDHDDARKMYATGRFTMTEVARRFGVSRPSVKRVVDPEWGARNDADVKARLRERYRRPCIDGCGRLAWHQRGHTGRCRQCDVRARTKTVREATLLCGECGEWKPDEAFPMHHGSISRRGRHSQCRACATIVRQAYRERVKVPCTRCGEPCLPQSEKNGGVRRGVIRDTGLCVTCYQATREKKTHCIHGHKRTPDNLFPGGSCRSCDRDRKAAAKAAA